MVDGLFITPNWAQSVTETYEFLTDVFTTRSGREQRAAMRMVPRRSLSFSTMLWNDNAKKFVQLLSTKGADSVEVLDHARFVATTLGDTAPLSSVLNFSKRMPWMNAGRLIAMQLATGAIRTQIKSVSGTSVTVTSPFGVTIPAGTVVLPRLETLMTTDQQVTMQSDRLLQATVSALVRPGTQTIDDLLMPLDDLMLLDDRPVLTVSPNWVKLPTFTIATTIDRVDYGQLISDYAPERVFKNTSQLSFLDRRGGDIFYILNLFLLCLGRAGEFWCPTWISDITAQAKISAGSSRLKVAADVDVGTNGGIALFFADGTSLMRRISRVDGSGAGEGYKFIYVTEPFPVDRSRAEIQKVSWLRLSRFASDSLTIEWLTDTVAQTQITVRSLETLPADVFTVETNSLTDDELHALNADDATIRLYPR